LKPAFELESNVYCNKSVGAGIQRTCNMMGTDRRHLGTVQLVWSALTGDTSAWSELFVAEEGLDAIILEVVDLLKRRLNALILGGAFEPHVH